MGKNNKNMSRVIIKQIILYLIFVGIIIMITLLGMEGCLNK